MELQQAGFALGASIILEAFELGFEVVEEQTPDELEDVAFARVVRPDFAALFGFHDALEQRTENGRTDPRPVEGAADEKRVAHDAIHVGDVEPFAEEFAVDVRHRFQLFDQIPRTLLHRRVENLEDQRQVRTEIRPIGRGVIFDEQLERLAAK